MPGGIAFFFSYYRAFLYALIENLYNSTNDVELNRIRDYVKKSIFDVVEKGGYERFAIETFHEEMVDLLDLVAKEKKQHQRQSDEEGFFSSTIHTLLNEENGTSDYCVWYLRVITSTYLKSDPDRFVHFIDDPTCSYVDIDTYCQKEIDPMGKECTMIGVLALAEAFQVNTEIEYMDGKELTLTNGKLIKHSFGGRSEDASATGVRTNNDCTDDSSALCITLLYRPGHYDILYK